MDDFRFADIRNRGDFDIVIFKRKVIDVPTNLAQPHNPDSDFAITHDCTPSISKINSQFFCCLCYIHASEIAMRDKKGPESFHIGQSPPSKSSECRLFLSLTRAFRLPYFTRS